MDRDDVMMIEYALRAKRQKEMESIHKDNKILSGIYRDLKVKAEEEYFALWIEKNLSLLIEDPDDVEKLFRNGTFERYCMDKCLDSIYN